MYGREAIWPVKVDTLGPFRTLSDVSACFFPLTNTTRDFMYNDTIGITIRLAVQTVLVFTVSLPGRPQKWPPTPNPPYRQPPSALQNPPIPPACMLKKPRQRKPSKFIVPFYPPLLQTVERLSMHPASCILHPAANRFSDTLCPKRKLHASASCTPNPSITHELVLVWFSEQP